MSWRFCFESALSGEKSSEVIPVQVVTGKNGSRILQHEMLHQQFRENVSEVGCQRQVSTFIELVLGESGPFAVDLPAFNRTSKNEHDVRLSMAGPGSAILAG